MMSQLPNQLITPPIAVLPAIKEQGEVTQLPASFVGKSGRFYIRQNRADGTGYHHRLTVWPSVETYNNRTIVPLVFCDAADALTDFSHEVKIYPESLTTTPPAYEPDRDGTDLGLTAKIDYSQRNAWKERLTQTRQRHAA